MENKALAALEPLIGDWEYTLYNAWFLDSMDTRVVGRTIIERLHNAFVVLRNESDGKPDDIWVIGYSDAQNKYQMFYYDQRGVARIFDMTFDGATWSAWREDTDFYQRFTITLSPDKMHSVVEASEDQGKTWRKDFDMAYVRKAKASKP